MPKALAGLFLKLHGNLRVGNRSHTSCFTCGTSDRHADEWLGSAWGSCRGCGVAEEVKIAGLLLSCLPD